MKLKEIAERIDAHLKRMEADPEINKPSAWGTYRFHHAQAWHAGQFVYLIYQQHHDRIKLTAGEAYAYLSYLDDGGTDYHHAIVVIYRQSLPPPEPIRDAYTWVRGKIARVDVIRETDKTIYYRWPGSNRINKDRKFKGMCQWFGSPQEALSWRIEHIESGIDRAKSLIERLENRLGELRVIQRKLTDEAKRDC